MRLVVRPLVSFLVLAALVFALLQGTGRVAFGLLAHLELAVNQVLSGRQIRVSGLRGDWRGFNPVVQMERLELPAGHLDDIYVELDLLETLWQGSAVLHRARVADGSLLLERVDGGWRLAGMPRGKGFDPMPFLTGTDQLEFRGSLGFVRDDSPAAALGVEYAATNRDGVGRHRLRVRNSADDCVEPCAFAAELELADGAWGVGAGRAALTVSATRFVVPAPLLGALTMQFDAVEVDWQGSADASSGRALVHATGALVKDGRSFAARLGAVTRGRDGRHWGQIDRFEVTQDAVHLEIPPLGFEVNDGVLHAALPLVPVADLTRMLESILAGHDVAKRWLDALDLAARIEGLHAFYRFATREFGYAFDVAEFDMDGYRGVPWIRAGAGAVVGYTRFGTGRPQLDVGHAVQIDIDAADMGVAFPDHLADRWILPHVSGRLQAWFRRNEFRLRGLELATRIGATEARGSLGISRLGKEGGDDRDKRIAALARVDRITVAEARRFVPLTLQPRLYQWLTETPMQGTMIDGRIAYQGQFRVPPGIPGRRLEIAGEIEDGAIRFHPEWPEVRGFSGRLEVAGREVRAVAKAAESLGADLSGTQFTLRDNGAVADVALAARLDASQALALVRQSPLQDAMPFVAPDWAGRGPLSVVGNLVIPVREYGRLRDEAEQAGRSAEGVGIPPGLAVDLAVELDGVDLDLPGYRLAFGGLQGPLRYGFPATLESDGIKGSLFEAPVTVTVTATSGDRRFRLAVSGTARSGDLWKVIDTRDLGITEGSTGFDAVLDVEAPAGSAGRRADAPPPRLSVRSDLAGLGVRLPGRYAKPADEAAPLEVDLEMPGDERRLAFTYRDARGWMLFNDRLERGAVGLGVEPPVLPDNAREMLFSGRIDRLGLDDLTAGTGSASALPLLVRLRDFTVDRLVLGTLVAQDASLEAELRAWGFDVRVESDDLTGSARRRVDLAATADAEPTPIDIDIEELHLPAAKGKGDPLSPDVIRSVPPMNVVIEEMSVGESDYGRWRFNVRREGDDLWFREIEARLRKVDIRSSEGVVWRGADNATTFSGDLAMANLAEVLPLWGYAPSVETERATLSGTVTWAGSPASFDLFALEGTVDARARTGRFLDVESGGGTQRILSLLNFTTVAKRISLDFSDVFGKGLSFDKLKTTFTLDHGLLTLVKPLDVEGTGLKFKLTGSVRLRERILDHDMVVTLPVSRGLPWYAAYVALANPIAGLGVLVGERVLRKPLEQFSSARYRITGTVENPEVELVSVFAASSEEPDRPVEVPVEETGALVPGAPDVPTAVPATPDGPAGQAPAAGATGDTTTDVQPSDKQVSHE